MYEGRLELYRSIGYYIEGQGTISVIKQDHICLENINILDDYIDHLWIRIKGCYKGKGDKVKFKAKVSLYKKNTKVGLTNFIFI